VAQRSILVDGATRAAIGNAFVLEALGAVQLKGKAAAVEVYAVSL
jgi:class 3 adenylate cyclase